MIGHLVRTSDGRVLNVGEGGDRRGKPVFALHGTPGSLMLYESHVSDASKRGIRLISYDRSGYGGSSPHPGRRVADAAKDVEAIADSLRLERFAVWGISGGGPHALACAALLRDRVVAAASLASPAPYPSRGLDWLSGMGEDNVSEFKAAMAGPEQLSRFLGPQRAQLLKATPEEIAELWESLLPPVDKAVLAGKLGPFLVSNLKKGLRPGYEGQKDDDLAFVSGWGFRPSDVSVPLLLWQGKHDKMVPFAHGMWLAEHIREADARLSSDDGHLTLFERHVPETHAWLLKHF
jgi:pimeloyl-ACP methyl ester carboxylesterase